MSLVASTVANVRAFFGVQSGRTVSLGSLREPTDYVGVTHFIKTYVPERIRQAGDSYFRTGVTATIRRVESVANKSPVIEKAVTSSRFLQVLDFGRKDPVASVLIVIAGALSLAGVFKLVKWACQWLGNLNKKPGDRPPKGVGGSGSGSSPSTKDLTKEERTEAAGLGLRAVSGPAQLDRRGANGQFDGVDSKRDGVSDSGASASEASATRVPHVASTGASRAADGSEGLGLQAEQTSQRLRSLQRVGAIVLPAAGSKPQLRPVPRVPAASASSSGGGEGQERDVKASESATGSDSSQWTSSHSLVVMDDGSGRVAAAASPSGSDRSNNGSVGDGANVDSDSD